MANTISVRELEAKILELEEIVVVIRATSDTQVEDYNYERKAAENTSVTDWLNGRIKPLLGEHEVTIINGDYTSPHGRTKLSTLRDGYAK